MADPRDRRSYRARQALRQRAKRIQKRQPRKLTRGEWTQIIFVILIIVGIVIGAITLAN